MSGSARVAVRTTVAGISISSSIVRNDELEQGFQETMPAGKSGTLTTRTDDNTGVATVASGHGITTSDTVSAFWDGGYRYGMTVTATTSTTISVDGGAGGNLPLVATALVVGKEAEHAIAITGNQLSVLAIGCDNRASIHFRDVSDASLLPYDLIAGEGRLWINGSGFTNPLAGDVVANVILANGGTVEKAIQVGMLLTTD